MNSRRNVLLAALSLTALGAAPAWAQSAPRLEAPWARPTVPGQMAGGAFLKITGGAQADRLLSASAAVSKSVELHTMVMEGDVMRMREVDAIGVPAGQTVELKPGGLHIMLMGLKAPLQNGTSFPLTLRFEKAGEVTVTVQVTSMPADAGMQKR